MAGLVVVLGVRGLPVAFAERWRAVVARQLRARLSHRRPLDVVTDPDTSPECTGTRTVGRGYRYVRRTFAVVCDVAESARHTLAAGCGGGCVMCGSASDCPNVAAVDYRARKRAAV